MATLGIGGDINEAVQKIRDEKGADDWAIFDYAPKSNNLRVAGSGSGGLSEFRDELNDGKIQFGYLRFNITDTFKYLFVSYCGDGVEGMRKGLFNNHAKEMEKWMSEAGRGFSVQINARNEDDLKENIVLDKINKSLNAFLKTNTLSGANKGQLKEQTGKYWNEQKQKDEAHNQSLSAHEQEKQKRLAESKALEQTRLGQQAQETLSEMEQRRKQDSEEHRQRQDEIAAAQSKRMQENTAKVLGDVQAQKAAQTIKTDAAHNTRAPVPTPASANPAARAAFTAKPAPAAAPPPAKKAPAKPWAPPPASKPSAAPVSKPPPVAAKPASAPVKAAAPPPVAAKPVSAPPPVAAKPPPPVAAKPPPPIVAAKPPTVSEAPPTKAAPPPPAARTGGPPQKAAPPPPAPRQHVPEPVPEPEPEPVYEEPAPEEPAYEEPAYEEPAYEEPAYEEPAYVEPVYPEEVPPYPEEPVYAEEAQAYEEQPAEAQAYAYPQARALYDYAAETETDLSFAEGDTVNILDDTDPSGWWKGELNGVEGFFPSNFVELIQ